jgi:hypothetical protein
LVDGSLDHALDRTEAGAPLTGVGVWTATNPDGTYDTSDSEQCVAWSPSAPSTLGTGGLSDQTDGDWTSGNAQFCDANQHLYCFEQ